MLGGVLSVDLKENGRTPDLDRAWKQHADDGGEINDILILCDDALAR
jgi:hypothetical protein